MLSHFLPFIRCLIALKIAEKAMSKADVQAVEAPDDGKSDGETSDEEKSAKKRKGKQRKSDQPKASQKSRAKPVAATSASDQPKAPRKTRTKRVASPSAETQRSRKQAKLTDKQTNTRPKPTPKGKGKQTEKEAPQPPSPREPSGSIEDLEARDLQRAMEESRITSQPGTIGSSSGAMERIASQSSAVSQPPSTAAEISSLASTGPQSDIDDIASDVPMIEISPGYSVPSSALTVVGSQFSSEDDLGYYGSFLLSTDLPANFVETWKPIKSSWEACGIFFGTQDESERRRSVAAYSHLQGYIGRLLGWLPADFGK